MDLAGIVMHVKRLREMVDYWTPDMQQRRCSRMQQMVNVARGVGQDQTFQKALFRALPSTAPLLRLGLLEAF